MYCVHEVPCFTHSKVFNHLSWNDVDALNGCYEEWDSFAIEPCWEFNLCLSLEYKYVIKGRTWYLFSWILSKAWASSMLFLLHCRVLKMKFQCCKYWSEWIIIMFCQHPTTYSITWYAKLWHVTRPHMGSWHTPKGQHEPNRKCPSFLFPAAYSPSEHGTTLWIVWKGEQKVIELFIATDLCVICLLLRTINQTNELRLWRRHWVKWISLLDIPTRYAMT